MPESLHDYQEREAEEGRREERSEQTDRFVPVDRVNETPQRFELVDMSFSLACQFMSQGRTAEAADELARASLYLKHLKRLRDGQPAPSRANRP